MLILILFLLPCFCCKNMGRMCRYRCSGCATEIQPRPSTPWGGWPPAPFRPPRYRVPYSQQDLEAYKSALPPQLHNSQGPTMHSQPPRPRPLSEQPGLVKLGIHQFLLLPPTLESQVVRTCPEHTIMPDLQEEVNGRACHHRGEDIGCEHCTGNRAVDCWDVVTVAMEGDMLS